eukprot:1504256-Rhodomonas_salina.1
MGGGAQGWHGLQDLRCEVRAEGERGLREIEKGLSEKEKGQCGCQGEIERVRKESRVRREGETTLETRQRARREEGEEGAGAEAGDPRERKERRDGRGKSGEGERKRAVRRGKRAGRERVAQPKSD